MYLLLKRDFCPGTIFLLLECEDLSIHLRSHALTYTAKKMQTVRSTLLDHVQDVSYPLPFFPCTVAMCFSLKKAAAGWQEPRDLSKLGYIFLNLIRNLQLDHNAPLVVSIWDANLPCTNVLYTKNKQKKSSNHFIQVTTQGTHRTWKKNIYAKEKQKIIPENMHTHSHIGEENEENHFSRHQLDPILTMHPYNLMCIKYANISQMFFVIAKHFINISRKLSVGGKGSLCKNMKK